MNWVFSAWRREGSVGILAVRTKSGQKGVKKQSQTFLNGIQCQGKRKWAQTELQEIPLQCRQKLFYCGGGQVLEMLYWKAVEFAPLERFKIQLGALLGNLL